jgi:hypothetical protein
MNAYEYGLENFKNKYQPKPNIVVFNDKTNVLDDLENNNLQETEEPQVYIYAEVSRVSTNTFSLLEPI